MKEKNIHMFSINKQKLFSNAMQLLCNRLSSGYFGHPLKKTPLHIPDAKWILPVFTVSQGSDTFQSL